MYKNISYHTRSTDGNNSKIMGGSFGGSIDLDTVNRLVKSHFTVVITNSGRAQFVDKENREVSLYFYIDPANTDAGRIALTEHAKRQRERAALEDAKWEEVNEFLASMSPDEALRKLKE